LRAKSQLFSFSTDFSVSHAARRREVELKLDVPTHSLYRLARSSLLQAARKKSSKPATLVSVYFDTTS